MPSSYVMPDVISVEVQFGVDIPPKIIQVPIVRAVPDKKAFLASKGVSSFVIAQAECVAPENNVLQ